MKAKEKVEALKIHFANGKNPVMYRMDSLLTERSVIVTFMESLEGSLIIQTDSSTIAYNATHLEAVEILRIDKF